MTSEIMRQLNRDWRKVCSPTYIKVIAQVMIVILIMMIVGIIGSYSTPF